MVGCLQMGRNTEGSTYINLDIMFTKGLTGFEIIKGIFKQKNTKKKTR